MHVKDTLLEVSGAKIIEEFDASRALNPKLLFLLFCDETPRVCIPTMQTHHARCRSSVRCGDRHICKQSWCGSTLVVRNRRYMHIVASSLSKGASTPSLPFASFTKTNHHHHHHHHSSYSLGSHVGIGLIPMPNRSVVFKKMLESENFTEARSGRIRIRDCSRDTFKSFIACMYGQDDGNSATDGRLMWELADKVSSLNISCMLASQCCAFRSCIVLEGLIREYLSASFPPVWTHARRTFTCTYTCTGVWLARNRLFPTSRSIK
jgi:hypothetical protein